MSNSCLFEKSRYLQQVCKLRISVVLDRLINLVSTAVRNKDLFIIADVIGVCKTVDEVTRFTTKANRDVTKRTLNLMDMSGKLVTVTLWGEEVSKDLR